MIIVRWKKTINGVKYYLPSNLTLEQKAIYVHIIDWKRKNITTERGMYKGHEYDAIFPNDTTIPTMIYDQSYLFGRKCNGVILLINYISLHIMQ